MKSVLFARLTVLAVAVALAPALWAEGGPESSKPPAKSDVVLRFSFWGDPAEKATVEKALAAFTAQSGITVEPMHIPSGYTAKMTTMLAAGDPPDTGYLSAPNAFRTWEQGKLDNLLPYIEREKGVTVDSWLETNYFWVDGKTIVGMSGDIQTYAMFYNVDLLKKAGIQPPTKSANAWTWDEFVQAAKKLTIDKQGRNALDPAFDAENIAQYGVHIPLWFGNLEALLARNGTAYTVDNKGREFGLIEPKGYEVLQAIADLINVHHVMPTPATAKGMPVSSVALQTGRYAMYVSGQYDCNGFGQTEGLNWNVAVLPKFTTTTAITGNAARVMYTDGKHKAETWKLILFMADPAGGIDLFRSGLWAPSKMEWFKDPAKVAQWAENNPGHPSNYKDVFFDAFLGPKVQLEELSLKNYSEISNTVTAALDPVWTGEKTAKQAMEEIAPKVQPLLQGAYTRR